MSRKEPPRLNKSVYRDKRVSRVLLKTVGPGSVFFNSTLTFVYISTFQGVLSPRDSNGHSVGSSPLGGVRGGEGTRGAGTRGGGTPFRRNHGPPYPLSSASGTETTAKGTPGGRRRSTPPTGLSGSLPASGGATSTRGVPRRQGLGTRVGGVCGVSLDPCAPPGGSIRTDDGGRDLPLFRRVSE